MISTQDFVLSVKKGKVAAFGPLTDLTRWPDCLSAHGREYVALVDGDTFFFWNEIRNGAGLTVGFTFFMPESPTFRNSSFVREASNVSLDGEEVTLFLEPCTEPAIECVQGFGSEILVNRADKTDCMVFMTDFSQNIRAFTRHELADAQA